MQSTYSQLKPLLLIFSCILILICVNLFIPTLSIGKFQIKKPKLFSDFLIKQNLKKKLYKNNTLSKEFKPTEQTQTNTIVDSTEIYDFCDSTSSNMEKLYLALSELKTKRKKIRIAYFGDSMIEGDLITQDLRNFLQSKFGGNGVGMMPITSVTASFRQSITHKFSKGWNVYSLVDTIAKKSNLGLMGNVFYPKYNSDTSLLKNTDWVEYSTQHKNRKIENAILYYGKSSLDNYLEYQNKKLKLIKNNIVNADTICINQNLSNIKISFVTQSSLPIFGLSIESDSGIFVDNFSLRGNSGVSLSKVKSEVYKEFDKLLNYDLIILHFGLNVVSENTTDYSWYVKSMNKTIAKLKSCFPNSAILLVSVSDKSYKTDSGFETLPGVPILVKNQMQLAEQNKIAFWNLYEKMGGYNTMVSWVESDTSYANKDYTHLNFRGANKVAKLFYSSLNKSYDKWLKQQTIIAKLTNQK